MGRSKYELTKKQYEQFLNNTVQTESKRNYGSWLRRHDPNRFHILYLEWVRDNIRY